MSMACIWWNRMSSDLRPIARPEYTINKSYVSLQFNHLITLWLKTYHTDQGGIVINPRLSVGEKTCIESEQYRQQGCNRKYRNDGNQSRRVRWRIWSVEVIYPAHGARSVMSRSNLSAYQRAEGTSEIEVLPNRVDISRLETWYKMISQSLHILPQQSKRSENLLWKIGHSFGVWVDGASSTWERNFTRLRTGTKSFAGRD